MTKTETWLVVGLALILALGAAFLEDRREGWRWHWDTGNKTHVIIHVQANPGVPFEKPRADRHYKRCKGFFLERDGTRQDALIDEDIDEISLDYLLPGESVEINVLRAPEGGKP